MKVYVRLEKIVEYSVKLEVENINDYAEIVKQIQKLTMDDFNRHQTYTSIEVFDENANILPVQTHTPHLN